MGNVRLREHQMRSGLYPGKQYELVVSISTLEHVGWNQKPGEPEGILQAFESLKRLLAPKGRMIVTMPIDYNDLLDELIAADNLSFEEVRYMKRIPGDNQWVETDFDAAMRCSYNNPFP